MRRCAEPITPIRARPARHRIGTNWQHACCAQPHPGGSLPTVAAPSIRAGARTRRGARVAREHVGGDALGNPHRRFMHRVPGQMRIARRRLDLRVAEQPADHRQGFAQRQRPRSVAVPAIVDAQILEPGALAYHLPGIVQVAHRAAGDLPRDHVRVALHPGDRRQHVRRLRRQRDRPRAGLRIAGADLARLQVHLVPQEVQDLALAAAGQQQQADRRHRVYRHPLAGLRLVQHPAQPPQLPVGEEPLAAAFPVFHHPPARIAALRDQPPVLRRVVDTRQHVDRPVRDHRRRPQALVQRRRMSMANRQRRHAAERGFDMLAHHVPVVRRRPGLAVPRDMVLQPAPGKLPHRRPLDPLRRRRLRHRVLARLDARDD